MITSLGYGTYFFFASLMIAMGFWSWFFIPETKGKTLEEMDALFGAPSSVRAGIGEAAVDDVKRETVHAEKV